MVVATHMSGSVNLGSSIFPGILAAPKLTVCTCQLFLFHAGYEAETPNLEPRTRKLKTENRKPKVKVVVGTEFQS